MKNFRLLPLLAFFILFTVNGLYAQIKINNGRVSASMGNYVIIDLNVQPDRSQCYTPEKKEHIRFESTSTNFSFMPDSMYYRASPYILCLVIKNVPNVEGIYEISFQKEKDCKVVVEDLFHVKSLFFKDVFTNPNNNSIGDADNFYLNNSYNTNIFFGVSIQQFCQELTKEDIALIPTSGGQSIKIDTLIYIGNNSTVNGVNVYYRIPQDAALGTYDLIFWPGTSCATKIRQFSVKNPYISIPQQFKRAKGPGLSATFYYRGVKSIHEYCGSIDLNKGYLRHKVSGKEISVKATDNTSSKMVTVTFDLPYNAESGAYELIFKNSCLEPLQLLDISKSKLYSNSELFFGRTNEVLLQDNSGDGYTMMKNCLSRQPENYSLVLKNGDIIKAESVNLNSLKVNFFIPPKYERDSVYLMVKDSLGCYESEVAAKKYMSANYLYYNRYTSSNYYNDQKVVGDIGGDALYDTCIKVRRENFYFTNGTDQIQIDSISNLNTSFQTYNLYFKIPANVKAGYYTFNIDKSVKTCNNRIVSGSSILINNPKISAMADSVFITPKASAKITFNLSNTSFIDPTSCQYNWSKSLKLINVLNGKEVIPDSVKSDFSSYSAYPSTMNIYFTPNKDFTYGAYQIKVNDDCGFPINSRFVISKSRFSMKAVTGTQGANLNATINSNGNGDYAWKGFTNDSLIFVSENGHYFFPVNSILYRSMSFTIPSDAPIGNYHLVNKDSSNGTFSILRNVLKVTKPITKKVITVRPTLTYLNQLSSTSIMFSLMNSPGNFKDSASCLYPKKGNVYLYNDNDYKLYADSIKVNAFDQFTARFYASVDVPLGKYKLMIESESCMIDAGDIEVRHPHFAYYKTYFDSTFSRCSNKRLFSLYFNNLESKRVDTLEYYKFSKQNTFVDIEKDGTRLYPDSLLFINSTLYALFTLPKVEYIKEDLNFSTGEKIKINFKVKPPSGYVDPKLTVSPIYLMPGSDQIIKVNSNSRVYDEYELLYNLREKSPEVIMEHESKLHSFPLSRFIPINTNYAQINFSIPLDILPGLYNLTMKEGFCNITSDVGAISGGAKNTLVQVSSNGIARPGGTMSVYALYFNSGQDIISNAKLKIHLNDKLELAPVSSGLFSKNGDTLIYSVPRFIPGKNYVLNFNLSVKTTATLRDSVICNMKLDVPGEVITSDNAASLKLPVRTSYDPNDKLVNRKEMVFDETNKNLVYTIRFQNTGNDTAFVVRIKDQLDPRFDYSSIKMLSNSHPMDFTLSSKGDLEFIFDNILLPDSTTNEAKSHGYVSFSMKLKDMYFAVGDSVSNQASIFFDYNDPVVTEYAITKIVSQGIVSKVINKESGIPGFLIIPNPANDRFSFTSPEEGTLSLFDARGVLEYTTKVSVGNNIIKVPDNLTRGFYTVLIETQSLSQRGKIVIAD